MDMTPPKKEETKIRTIRLPTRLWRLLDAYSEGDGKNTNNLLWRLVERFFIGRGKMKESERKRLPID